MSNKVSRRDSFVSDIMKLIVNGSSNDVKIVLQDGEIMANKDIISARCEYFATMFSNKEVKFIEGETNSVDMNFCRKVVMEKIISFLFIGDVELHDLSFAHLMELMHMSNMMLLEDLFDDIQKFVLGFLPDSGVNCGSIPELVEGLIQAEQFKLETIKDALLLELFISLKDVPHIPEVVKNSEAFKFLPASLLKEVLLHEAKEKTVGGSKERLDAFVFWLSENDCSEEDKKEITDSFIFDEFTPDELLTDVRRSGLFSIEKIDGRLQEMFDDQKKSLGDKDQRFRTLKSYYMLEKKKIEDKEKIIGQLKSALSKEKEKTKILEHSIEMYKDAVKHHEYIINSKEGRITLLKNEISDKEQTIAENEDEISDKESTISTQEAQITELKREVYEKDQEIYSMKLKQVDLEGGIMSKNLDNIRLSLENDELRDKVRNRGRGRGRGNRNFNR